MSRTNSLVWLTGAAMGIAGTASAQSLDESRAYSAELLADAQERASLLQAGASGHDENGFYVGSADGNNRLGVSGTTQHRYQVTLSDSSPTVADDTFNEFYNSDTRIALHGHVGSPDVFFNIEVRLDDNPATGPLTNAYAGYRYGDGWSIRAGQFRAPLMKEDLVRYNKQQAVNRSGMNSYFAQGFSQGIEFTYAPEGEQWRAMAAFTDGLNTAGATPGAAIGGFPAGTAPTAPSATGNFAANSDFALTGRFEYAMSGEFGQFDTFSSGHNGAEGLLIGGAAHFQGGDDGLAAGSPSAYQFTADATWQTSQNYNVFGAVVLRNIDAAAVDGTDLGFIVQGGYWLNETTEVYGRFDAVLADTVSEDFFGIAAGANWFPIADNRHLKFTGEIAIFPEGTISTAGAGGFGPVAASAATGNPIAGPDTNLSIRGQVQLDF